MKLIDRDNIPWMVDGIGEIPVITKEEIYEMPILNAIPIEWIKEWTNKYPELVSETAFAWMIEDWEKEQEKLNEEIQM